MGPKHRWRLTAAGLAVTLALGVGCRQHGVAVPDAGAVRQVVVDPAYELSQQKLEESLKKLEALKQSAEPADAAAPEVRLSVELPLPPPTAAAAADAGKPSLQTAVEVRAPAAEDGADSARTEKWAKVAEAFDTQPLADAVGVVSVAWVYDGYRFTPECEAALKRALDATRRLEATPWESSAADVSESLDGLPSSDPLGRKWVAALWSSLATRAQNSHEQVLAQRYARRALTLEEDTPRARMVLAAEAYDENDFDEAQKQWDWVLRLNPQDADARQRLDALLKERKRFGDKRKTTAHFAFTYDRSLEEVAVLAAEALEVAYRSVGRLYEVYPDHTVTVVLYADEEFNAVKHTAWSGGFYDGKVRVPAGGALDQVPRFKEVLFHEYAHGLFDRATRQGKGAAPAWLNEGMATVAGKLANPVELGGCRNGHFTSLRALHAPFGALSRTDARPSYLVARHAVEQLQRQFGAAKLHLLLGELSRNVGFEPAFHTAFGVTYAAWVEAFDKEAERDAP